MFGLESDKKVLACKNDLNLIIKQIDKSFIA